MDFQHQKDISKQDIYTMMIKRIAKEIYQLKYQQYEVQQPQQQPINQNNNVNNNNNHNDGVFSTQQFEIKNKQLKTEKFSNKKSKKERKLQNRVLNKKFGKQDDVAHDNNSLAHDNNGIFEKQEENDDSSPENEEPTIPQHKQNAIETEKDTLALRKRQFKQTFSLKNTGRKFGIILTGLAVIAYFILTYFEHESFKSGLQSFTMSYHLFFDRYRYLMLMFGYFRERIIANDPPASLFDTEDMSDLDYYQKTLENEQRILEMRLNHNDGVFKEMVWLQEQVDSPRFCEEVIGEATNQKLHSETEVDEDKLINQDYQHTAFSGLINTVIRACNAAREGDIQTLSRLKSLNIDLNLGDWDQRTPLHFAVRAKQFLTVKYLIEQAKVNINNHDRWGSTPLNYAQDKQIYSLLVSNGATLGTNYQVTNIASSKLTDNEVRMFYAAFYNDKDVMDDLIDNAGVNINSKDFDGRTPMHIAAAEGYTDMVKLLLAHGADIDIIDSHGYDPVQEARRANHMALHLYLDSIQAELIVKKQCNSFANGLFAQGFHSALANFLKKYQDLQIENARINGNYTKRLQLLKGTMGENTNNTNTSNTLRMFFEAQTLYINKIIQVMDNKVLITYNNFTDNYSQQAMGIFIGFLVLDIIMILIAREKIIKLMKKDIFESRGMLNLLPDKFFEDNKNVVEKIFNKLKN